MSQLQFLKPPPESTAYDEAGVVIIPAPFEKTTSYASGTAKGPAAILEASTQVEYYDPELKQESWKAGIHTLDSLLLENLDSKEALDKIEDVTVKVLKDGKFPIVLGGEHAISGATIKAAAKQAPDLSVLQIDAHADLRESYEGTKYSHACAMRLAHPHVKKIVEVGIRSIDTEEVIYAKENPNIQIIYDHERRNNPNWIQEAIDGLTDPVFLTIDVDGFDPTLIPSTGTPEPGGLSWYEGLDLIRALFEQKKVIGCDVVELLPQEHHHASSFTVAKLVYKLVGYWQCYQKQKS